MAAPLDKNATAVHLKADLLSGTDSSGAASVLRRLRELLDAVLSPETPAADPEALAWCRCLIAGGEGFEEFRQTVRSYDNAALCGLVWTANFVAYRCRTCGISPCMSLCAECFHHGDHTGHDFNMFRSQAGGACDCGDGNVMRETGFCQRHRLKTGENVPLVPRDLLLMSEMVLPRFIISVIQYLREGYTEPDSGVEQDLQKVLQQLDPQISFLEELTKMGGAMRTVLTKILTNQQTFKDLSMGQEDNPYAKQNYEKYLSALKNSGLVSMEEKSLPASADLPPGGAEGAAMASAAAMGGEAAALDSTGGPGWRRPVGWPAEANSSIMDSLKHKCFLEELLFWTIKYEFPQKMVTFLLNMLPDQDYKITFTKTFVQHYAFIMKTLMKSHESDTMSNRIVHISVQLFSNEELARHVTEECHLLDIMVTVLLYMMESCLVKSKLQDEENSRHVVVNCGEALLKNNTYWPLVSDFINILSHQSMNLNKRELNEHVEFESQTYYAAFAAELEACAQPIKTVVRYCLEALQLWFDAICFVDEPAPNQVSFHLPLHRYYAMFLSKASLSEIHSHMWVRNGLQIKGQAMTYVQSHFCNSMIDPDIYLLQVCASRLDPDYFISSIPENPNPKSGIVPGSCSFEEMLSGVADFKEPVFEPGGSMQQGMYTPKAPVLSCSLKQAGVDVGTPWPPYKERSPLHPSYRGLIQLLHCKTLHIVIFTLLYKIWMDHQNMSEHVLCMVLYLIELGLDNQLQEHKEEEEPCSEEHCHDSWFPGTSLLSNLHHVINYVRVRLPETAPEVKREPLPSTSADSASFEPNLREAQVFSLVAERRRKFQEIINRSSTEAASAQAAVRPKSSSTRCWVPPGAPPQLVTEILEVRESMLSLLIKLHQKLSAKQNSLPPGWLEEATAAAARTSVSGGVDAVRRAHGDGITAIERILTKAAGRSRHCQHSIQEICGKVSPPVPPKKSSPADKKTMDKEESFMETAMDVESPEGEAAMDLGGGGASDSVMDSEVLYDCVICGQSGPSTGDRPTGLVVLLQASSVLGHRCKTGEAKKLPTSDEEHIYAADTCGSSCLQSVSIGWDGGVYNDQVLQGFSVDKGEFTCPLCRQLSNSVIPCQPGRGLEATAWHAPTTKKICVLVKEVEDLQEQLAPFPIESTLSKEMELVIKDIKNSTQKKTNLELELVHRGGNLCSGGASAAAKRSCLSADEDRREVAMLFRDVPSLLIIFILTMPQPLRKEHFTCVVKMLYNLQFVQALVALSAKLSPDERYTWCTSGALKKNAVDGEKRLDALLSHVISELSSGEALYLLYSE
ncbi:hypothetical protein CRUP_011600, partial [Coryphaenoides rupestris]